MKVTIFHNVAHECRTCGRLVMEIGDDLWAHRAGHIPAAGLVGFDGYQPGLRCREDSLPQPPYVLLGPAPVHLVPVRQPVLWSVHQGRRWR